MKIKSLKLDNFRGISDLQLDFHDQINVLVGVNGVGKSAVLDCLAIMLSRLIGRIRSSSGTGRFFVDKDITNGAAETRNTITVSVQKEEITWRVAKTRRGRRKQTITHLEEINGVVDKIHYMLEKDEGASIPVAVYYPVNRAVLDVPLRIRKRHPFDQLSAYDQALSGKQNSFRIFFEWFREREDLENEKRLKKRRYQDPQLQAVRDAVKQFLPGVARLRVRRQPLRMVVDKDDEELIVNQLSDGEKCSLALVGDLARRMAIANPSSRRPLEGTGVVLIDEIDLHLHPEWQRRVVPSLTKTFPHCQFILTTHSPQVINHVRPESLWLLERERGGVTASRPQGAYGLEVGRIFADLMKTPVRPDDIEKLLTNLFRLIEGGELKKAKAKIATIRKRVGDDPDLAKADVLIRRKEILGK